MVRNVVLKLKDIPRKNCLLLSINDSTLTNAVHITKRNIINSMSHQDRNRFLTCVFHTQIGCALVANIMMGCYGLVLPASSFLIPQLEDKDSGFGINQDQVSWLGKDFCIKNARLKKKFHVKKYYQFIFSKKFSASIVVMGMLTGSICGGYQSEKLGRRKSLMLDCLFFTIGVILSAAAPNFNTILVARWLVGHASASTKAVAPLYTSEISQPIIRNRTGSLAMICYSVGYAFCLIFGALFPWRLAVSIGEMNAPKL